jgi:methionine synthase / methylenetetrahydrofolate reductase(NADPH)
MDFLQALARGPLVFDGAMGTQLYERGSPPNRSFDELSLTNPALVEAIHRDYLQAGADVLQTNTYGANRFALQRHGLADRAVEMVTAAARIARKVAGTDVLVAGSIGPSGLKPKDLMRQKTRRLVFEAYREVAAALVHEGCDLLLFETFDTIGELELAVEATFGLHAPVVAQACFGRNGVTDQTDDGASPEEVVARMVEMGVDVVGANCVLGPEQLLSVVERMVAMHQQGVGKPVIMQPNAGHAHLVDGRMLFSSPETFGVVCRRAFKLGVAAIGGCCGTGAHHVHRAAGAARMLRGGTVPAPTVKTTATPMTAVPLAERSKLGGKISRGEFVVSIEVSPPAGVDPTKVIDRIMTLDATKRVDAVNIPDGPRATVRMSNQAFARTVLERVQHLEPIVHVCARDKNLLALQADLIGAHVHGIRNTVIITGDPPKVGDYPDATAVFDLDSIGLLGMAAGLNVGLDPAGKAIGGQTSFCLLTGAEPAAVDFDREIRRLTEKRDAGAQAVMTQPVFDIETLDKFLRAIEHLKLPVLVGILPLASSKNAEFLHHNVPGMRVPDAIRERMRKAGEGPAAASEGVAIAAEALRALKHRVQGVYMMPPFGRVELALQVLDAAM